MKKVYYICLLTGLGFMAQAQSNIEQILQSIKQNNVTLNALRESAAAEKIGNKTGLTPSNPEVELGYLWGSPADIGARKDLSITQEFDFPTAYRYKSQLSKGMNRQVDIVLRQQEREILSEARGYCVELIYRNRLNDELAKRKMYAEKLATSYESLFEKGEINIIEYNKTKLNRLKIEKDLELNKVDIATLEAELKRMNNEQPLPASADRYEEYLLPKDFKEWSAEAKANNPMLLAASQEVELSRKQEQLTKAMNLPKITTGYVSERIQGTTQQGIMLGMSIPLWENKNTLRHRKAQTITMQSIQHDTEQQYNITLRTQYDKANKLSAMLEDYKQILHTSNNEALLDKAFEQGQLSLINYLLELSEYYDTVERYLETERDYHQAVNILRMEE
jgi:Outer membrane protein